MNKSQFKDPLTSTCQVNSDPLIAISDNFVLNGKFFLKSSSDNTIMRERSLFKLVIINFGFHEIIFVE